VYHVIMLMFEERHRPLFSGSGSISHSTRSSTTPTEVETHQLQHSMSQCYYQFL